MSSDGLSWTCARCEMTTRQMSGHERPRPPATWMEDEGLLFCLSCQRGRAAEAAAEAAPADASTERRAQLRAWAVVEFEIERDPHRTNGEIARAVRSSVPAVLKARRRLEARAGDAAR